MVLLGEVGACAVEAEMEHSLAKVLKRRAILSALAALRAEILNRKEHSSRSAALTSSNGERAPRWTDGGC